jgi:nitrate reductase assembly molybdenum cofactor insertion protein NarJ
MTRAHAPADPRLATLLREAAWWRLLGRLFERPDAAWRTDVQALAAEVDDDRLRAAARAAMAEATEGRYHAVFGPGGPAPPREVSYRDTLELGSVMSSIADFYEAFGYAPRTAETPDHVSVEAGFIAFLRLKEAYALAEEDAERAAVARRAAERFVAEHLAWSAPRLADLLERSGISYLQRASRALAAAVGAPPTRLPVLPPLPNDGDDEVVCGMPWQSW